MRVTIREARMDECVAVAEVYGAADPRRAVQADALRYDVAHRDARTVSRRLLAVHDGAIVGVSEFAQHPEMHHPRKFAIQLAVRPDWQRRGIGSALYERTVRALARYDPLSLRATVHNSQPSAARFLAHRGFREEMRFVEMELDVARFDDTRTARLSGNTYMADVAITTLANIMREPSDLRALYDLVCEVRADAPLPDAPTNAPFDAFLARMLEHPAALPEAYFIAVADARYVGCASLLAADEETLYAGLTGVRAAYRRQGIATALKLRAIAFARANGYARIKTVCAAQNDAIRRLNACLGFDECGGWTGYVRDEG